MVRDYAAAGMEGRPSVSMTPHTYRRSGPARARRVASTAASLECLT